MSNRTRLEAIREAYLTQDELRRLFRAIESVRDRALFLTAYRHGLRASEVGLLTVGDVDFEAGRLTVRRLKNSLPGHSLETDEVRYLRLTLRCRIRLSRSLAILCSRATAAHQFDDGCWIT